MDITALMLIAFVVEAASTSETSVNFYDAAWRCILGDTHFHTRRRENLNFHRCTGNLIFLKNLLHTTYQTSLM
jgi:hypothetical protein